MAGSYRKRGCTCPKGKRCNCGATWSFRIDVGTDPKTGKRKQETGSGFSTKAEAETACAAIITDYERGTLSVAPKNETVGSFMRSYMDNVLKNEIEPRSWDNKDRIMNNHIDSVLGKIRLTKLTPMQVQNFINGLTTKGLSPGTIQNVMRLVNQTLTKALEWGYVNKNVASLTSKPSYKPEKFIVWNKEQFEYFLQSSKNSRLHPYYLIALMTGMRPGEIAALSWDRIDMKQNVIRVERNVVWTKARGIYIKETPKNDPSKRSITIPESVSAYLRKLRLAQDINELNLVVPGIKNPIIYNSVINQIYKTDVALANLPYLKPHGLRHTHATYLLSPKPFGLGQALKAVSERLGHANPTTTLNTYSHVLPNMQESLAEQLGASLNF